MFIRPRLLIFNEYSYSKYKRYVVIFLNFLRDVSTSSDPHRRTSDQTGMTYSGYSSRAKGRFFSLPDSQYSSKGHNPRFSKLRQSGYGQQSSSNIPDDAILLLPGVNVRVHYQSTTTSERPSFKAHSASFSSVGSGGEFSDGQETSTTGSGSWRTGSKSAGLYAWLSVQPLPREMIVQPSLLDFLNKALEPIVIAYPNTDNNQESMSDSSSSTPESRGNGNESMVSSSSVDYSFPVNVVVCVRVQPSDVRFSCLPVSKVECLLRLPLLDLVISSSKNQNKQATQKFNLGSSPKKQKGQAAGARNRGTSPSRSEVIDTDIGGVSFTVCLSRFSFCIFHPYGKQYGSTSERSFVESGLFPGRRKARGIVPQPISGRKDSLSLNVEFIKFNLFRKRMKVALSNGGRGKRSSSSSDDNKTVVKVSGKQSGCILWLLGLHTKGKRALLNILFRNMMKTLNQNTKVALSVIQ